MGAFSFVFFMFYNILFGKNIICSINDLSPVIQNNFSTYCSQVMSNSLIYKKSLKPEILCKCFLEIDEIDAQQFTCYVGYGVFQTLYEQYTFCKESTIKLELENNKY